ncbi:hypothetical protein DUNSADRAFT_7602 [Dunaliella salina]|uniref:Encoded protein n=1 Tax=Dunaliella salina TaxID=3046 RepID=A0ABQ7GL00_DUNSA|nr:hypothetical protein DUNSADRAFT_7602 [Dunaliella salina]|eukprot:KAF5835277.1 hypothetical protein DUNSADRAFT_7602 [Dunaliella salina]
MHPPTGGSAPSPQGAEKDYYVDSKGHSMALVSPFAQAACVPDMQTGPPSGFLSGPPSGPPSEPPSGMGRRQSSRLSTVLSWKLSSMEHSSACVSMEATHWSQGSRACKSEEVSHALHQSTGLSRKSTGGALTSSSHKKYMRKLSCDSVRTLTHDNVMDRWSGCSKDATIADHNAHQVGDVPQEAQTNGVALLEHKGSKHEPKRPGETTTNSGERPQGIKALSTLLQKVKGWNEKRCAAVDPGMAAPTSPSSVREALKSIFG